MAQSVTMRVWRGDASGGDFQDYTVERHEGEVVLDVIHRIQASVAGDLAVRWNCKAGKCGSCSAEINGYPRLMCLTRMSTLALDEPITVGPMQAFPVIRDLVTDVSFNYEMAKRVPRFSPRPRPSDGVYRMRQREVERTQEFRKCIECFLCQDVCHVIRDHEENKAVFAGPRFFIRYAELEMHPLALATASRCCGRRWASLTATSPSAAPRSVPRASRSPRTGSSPSRNGSCLATSIRSAGWAGLSAAGVDHG